MNQHSDVYHEFQDDSLDFYQVTRSLLNNRRALIIFLSISVAVSMLLYASYLTESGKLKYSIDTLNISLEFPGISEHRYPDGSKFSPNDIISNDILRELYNKYEIEKIGPMDQFIAAFSGSYIGIVDPNAVIEEKKEKGKTVTVVKPGQILTNNYSMVRVSLNSKQVDSINDRSFLKKLSTETRAKILGDIPVMWAEKFKKLYLSYDVINPLEIVDFDDLQKKEYRAIYKTTLNYTDEFLRSASRLKETYPISNFRSAKHGLTLDDILFKIKNDVRNELYTWYSIPEAYGIFKNREWAGAELQNRLYNLEKSRQSLDNRYWAIKMVLEKDSRVSGRDFQQTGSVAGQQTGKPMNGDFTKNPIPNEPQTSRQFQSGQISLADSHIYDRVFELGIKSTNIQYINGLTDKLLETVEQRSNTESEIAEIARNLTALEKFGKKTKLPGGGSDRAKITSDLEARLPAVIDNFKKWMQKGVDISNEYYNEAIRRYGGIVAVMAPVSTAMITPPAARSLFRNLVILPLLAMLVLFAVFCFFLIFREGFMADAATTADRTLVNTQERQNEATSGIKGIVEKV